jgi:hypothetical protein
MAGYRHHSKGTSSIVQDGSPRFMVGWKCHGASRCVPLCVEIHLLHSPALAIGQIVCCQSIEEFEHAGQALLMLKSACIDEQTWSALAAREC